ncbi:ANK3, partial [Symbiodinium sp. KB8]
MSQTGSSRLELLVQALSARLELLEQDNRDLQARVARLESEGYVLVRGDPDRAATPPRPSGYDLPTSASTSSPARPPSVACGSSGSLTASSSATLSDAFRQRVADDIGAYIQRCLAGNNRGSSGRERVNLSNRIYVIARDAAGNLYDPVRVENTWRDSAWTCAGTPSLHLQAAPWIALAVVGESESGEPIVALPGKAWDRENPLEALAVRVWIGRLGADWSRYVEIVEIGSADLELDTVFGEPLEAEHADCIPFAPDLVEAAGDRLHYQTAEEGTGEEPAPQPTPVEAAPAWATRVEELERGMGDVRRGIQDILRKLGKPDVKAPAKAAAPRPSALRGGGASGQEMARVVAQSKTKIQPAPLTVIAENFTSSKRRASTLEGLLEGGAGADGLGELADNMLDRMGADFGLARSLPGADRVPVTARAWVESRARIQQQFPTTVRMAWILSGIVDALARGEHDEGLARALVLAAIEQLSLDRGSWTLAEPMLLEEPAPLSSFHGRQMPTGSEQPFTRLLDARSIELLVYQVRE